MTSNDWRLVPGFVAFIIPGQYKVYLAPSEKKQYALAVSKQIESSFSELESELNEFELKIERIYSSSGIGVFIKNPDIFPEDAWYRVMNFYNEHLLNFITETSSIRGTFDHEFEAIFSESTPDKVSFVSSDMSSYKMYMEEMKRRINCEVNRKCKKWIPGHRYDTLKETYYYLGEVLSRREDPKNSVFITDPAKMVSAYLYTNVLNDEESISDILKTRAFGDEEDNIKVLYTVPSAVESGEALKSDVEDISDYWEYLIENTKKTCIVPSGSGGYSKFEKVGKVFNILSYQSLTNLLYNNETAKNLIADFYTDVAKDTILYSWNNSSIKSDYMCSDSLTLDQNKQALKTAIIAIKTGDQNISRMAYYPEFFNAIGINVDEIVTDVLSEWSESNLLSDFDSYCKYSFYFDNRRTDSAITSRQRVDSTAYKLDVVTLADIFGNNELTEELIKLVNESRNSCGAGISKYAVYNTGTKRKPIEYVNCEITLNDLIRYEKSKSGLSENLKNEIMRLKFTRVIVSIDKTREVE